MTSIEIAGSFDELESLLKRPAALQEPVILTKAGIAYAAVVPLENWGVPDSESSVTWNSIRFQEIMARSQADSAAGREQPLDDVIEELGLSTKIVSE